MNENKALEGQNKYTKLLNNKKKNNFNTQTNFIFLFLVKNIYFFFLHFNELTVILLLFLHTQIEEMVVVNFFSFAIKSSILKRLRCVLVRL